MKLKKNLILVIFLVLFSGCKPAPDAPATTLETQQDVPTVVSSQTPEVEESQTAQIDTSNLTEPRITSIYIDGTASDWEIYPVTLVDSVGDARCASFDIVEMKVFANDHYLYLMLVTKGERDAGVQLDVYMQTGEQSFMAVYQPDKEDSGRIFRLSEDEWLLVDSSSGNIAQGEVIEIKLPLSVLDDTGKLTIQSVQPMTDLCSDIEWAVIDVIDAVEVTFANEKEPAPVAADEILQLCRQSITDPLPMGAGVPADIQLFSPGYTAEWFVMPGDFNMPLEVLMTPSGEILVQSVRSQTLYRVSLDGEIDVYTRQMGGYLGAVTSQGDVYIYSSPGGVIWRAVQDGVGSEFIRSPLLDTPCSSGFGLGPDGNLYVAYNACGERSQLYQITMDREINLILADIPSMSALRSTADGRFLGAGNQSVYEIFLEDGQVIELFNVPKMGGVSESGMTLDDDGRIYLSTGTRAGQGEIWRITLDGEAEQIAEIPGNGLSGIEWLAQTNEIVGGQLVQGSLLAVDVEQGVIREIVKGNGLVTPMAMAFSVCGDLVVSNDDGGTMTLVEPDGEVLRFFNYLSYTPPVPYLAVSVDHVVYASECAPGLPNGISVMYPGSLESQVYLRGLAPSGILWQPDGSLIVAETLKGQIVQLYPDGNRSVLVEGLQFPQALAQDSDGMLYAAVGGQVVSEALRAPFSAESIVRIDSDGSVQKLADIPQGIFALAFSPGGSLLAAGWNTVFEIDMEGGYRQFADGFEGAVGLAFDLAGNLYVSDHQANGIIRIGGFPQGTLSGSVRNADGLPEAGVRIQVYSSFPLVRGTTVATSEQGYFSLPVAPGRYIVLVLEQGIEIGSLDDVFVEAEKITQIDLFTR